VSQIAIRREVSGRRQNGVRRTFLRWAGSKKKLIPRLEQFWSATFSRYIEPFAGSACLFFSIEPSAAILGDTNKELIDVYRVLRDDPERIHRRLVAIPRNKATYYRWRAKEPKKLDTATRALRFVYLNHNCFNGIYRTNVQGNFNVPFGSKLASYPTRIDFIRCSELLTGTRLVAGDFQKTLADVARGDFIYLDPPYPLAIWASSLLAVLAIVRTWFDYYLTWNFYFPPVT
jgi:DNA adenine methylase